MTDNIDSKVEKIIDLLNKTKLCEEGKLDRLYYEPATEDDNISRVYMTSPDGKHILFLAGVGRDGLANLLTHLALISCGVPTKVPCVYHDDILGGYSFLTDRGWVQVKGADKLRQKRGYSFLTDRG